MTIWCQGSLQADVYHLYREEVYSPVGIKAQQDSSNKTSFSIESVSSQTAGLYQCAYHIRRNSWSERSDQLRLVVTGKGEEPGPLPLWVPPHRQKERSVGSGDLSTHSPHLGCVG